MQVVKMDKAVQVSDWITPDSIPDPNPLPRVFGWRILIRPISIISKQTKGGIFMPASLMDEIERATCVGRILAMGGGCYKHASFNGERWCEVGDLVSYGRFDGIKHLFRGVKVILLDDKDIRMGLDDATDIDPAWNLVHY